MIILGKDRIDKAIEIAEKTSSLEALKSLPELEELEIVNQYDEPRPVGDNLKVVMLNAERGTYIDEIEAYMKHHPALQDADIVFFNELDYGLARTGNINTTLEISKRLCMNYVFGVEFMELTPGESSPKETSCNKNLQAFHGNAIMSRYKLHDPMLFRLPVTYDWFHDSQKRFGTRNAVFAKVKFKGQEIGLVCTHLENRTLPEGREIQTKALLEQIEKHYNDIPVIIAGDMNTNTFDGSNSKASELFDVFKAEVDRVKAPEKYEPLLQLVESYGYDYKASNLPGKITRRKPVEGKGDLEMNLDWFFTKGMNCTEPDVVCTIFTKKELPGLEGMEDSEGLQFSDHNAISGYFTVNGVKE